MLKTILVALLPLLILFSYGSDRPSNKLGKQAGHDSGTLEKMIVANGSVAMDLNLVRLNGTSSLGKGSMSNTLRFDIEESAFFKTIVFNGEFRGVLPSSMGLIPTTDAALPASLNTS